MPPTLEVQNLNQWTAREVPLKKKKKSDWLIFGYSGSLLLHRLSLVLSSRGYLLVAVWASHCSDFSCCRAQAQNLWHTSVVTPQCVESSWTQDRTCVPYTGRQILNHWVTRAPSVPLLTLRVVSCDSPNTTALPPWTLCILCLRPTLAPPFPELLEVHFSSSDLFSYLFPRYPCVNLWTFYFIPLIHLLIHWFHITICWPCSQSRAWWSPSHSPVNADTAHSRPPTHTTTLSHSANSQGCLLWFPQHHSPPTMDTVYSVPQPYTSTSIPSQAPSPCRQLTCILEGSLLLDQWLWTNSASAMTTNLKICLLSTFCNYILQ